MAQRYEVYWSHPDYPGAVGIVDVQDGEDPSEVAKSRAPDGHTLAYIAPFNPVL